MRIIIRIGMGLLVMAMASPVIAGMLYSHQFTTMDDVTGVLDDPGKGEVGIGLAPGGKPGNALYNKKLADGSGYSQAVITPSGATFPTSGQTTIIYRLYIDGPSGWAYSGYHYPQDGSAEGPAVWTTGNLVHTTNVNSNILVPGFKANTWYTIAEVGSPGGVRPTYEDVYVAEGIVDLTPADLKLGGLMWWYSGTGDRLDHMVIFNPLGAGNGSAGIYLADYTINEGLDLTIVPEPVSALLFAFGAVVLVRRRPRE